MRSLLQGGVVREWLGDLSFDELGAQPLARAGTAVAARAALDWRVLARVLAQEPDVLVVARGAQLDVPPPRTLDELAALFAAGAGLCVRHTERCDPGLAAIAEELDALIGPAQVQLFATPPGTHGFTWHYDDEDVFIVQTLGAKDYYLRQNTVAADRVAAGAAFRRFTDERSPLCAATLVAGDFLYIPSRWWHMAEAAPGGPALSISVGVRPRARAT